MFAPYANVCVTGWPSIARSAALLPPSTVIETPPFAGVAVSWPRNEYRIFAGPLPANAAPVARSAAATVARRILVRIG